MPTVNYNGLIADVREQDLQECIAMLSQCSHKEQKQILASVKRTLDEALSLADKKHAFTPQEQQNIANDIGIWFVGEIIAGRAEQYRAPLQ